MATRSGLTVATDRTLKGSTMCDSISGGTDSDSDSSSSSSSEDEEELLQRGASVRASQAGYTQRLEQRISSEEAAQKLRLRGTMINARKSLPVRGQYKRVSTTQRRKTGGCTGGISASNSGEYGTLDTSKGAEPDPNEDSMITDGEAASQLPLREPRMVNRRFLHPWKRAGLTLTPKALSNQLLPTLQLSSEGTTAEGLDHPAWLLPPPSLLCEGTVTEGVAYTPRKSRCAPGTAGLPVSVIDASISIISDTLPSSGVLHCPHPHVSTLHILC